MIRSNVIQISKFRQDILPQNEILRDFKTDLIDLFSGARQGHMEKWEYWEASFPGDPAGGETFWENLIRRPGQYYLPQGDIDTLSKTSMMPAVEAILQAIEVIVELGPGSAESVSRKTFSFLRHARKYIAVDLNVHQAEHAAKQVRMATGMETSHDIAHYHYPNLPKERRGKTGFIMWGGSIGNIAGSAGADPLPGLVRTLRAFADTCNPGDTYFVSIDTETNAAKLTAAYNEKLLSLKFLSILHAAKKMGLTEGEFTPETWTHRSVWHEQSRQVAHYLIPGSDQNFTIAGRTFMLSAGQAVISNNSYKFTPDQVIEAAKAAGFSRAFMSVDRPIALLIATK